MHEKNVTQIGNSRFRLDIGSLLTLDHIHTPIIKPDNCRTIFKNNLISQLKRENGTQRLRLKLYRRLDRH